ncbi:TetR/AcrR family transcriptional regulator [Saccharopolyspora indica]|uniref:TetR/AcrR family transcriptional regulator n=1 Tax=Saccharopolyspora indica TaxID=1229659 RepID=UPI0022EA4662|nr:TetR/AcrR family transcriptional regulator [Saccharopolyspora indica]MDA3646688.1 helix-turn-helix domain containing protein [Saccharopolyspora indica]
MDTRSELLLAAERLFALHGIDGVSLRQIAAAAGQRNVAAAHYHFGDKSKLIGAIFTSRLAHIDQRRTELLDAARANGADADPWHLCDVLARPFAEQAARPGSHYARFLARLYEHAGHTVETLPEYGLTGSAEQVTRLLGELLAAQLPEQVAQYRIELAGRLLITGTADLEQHAEQAGDVDEQRLSWLTDALAGLLTAPAGRAASSG